MVRRARKGKKPPDLLYGEEVEAPWSSIYSVRGTVHEIYGYDDDLRVVVLITPESSGQVVDEPTTVVWPITEVRRVKAPPDAAGELEPDQT